MRKMKIFTAARIIQFNHVLVESLPMVTIPFKGNNKMRRLKQDIDMCEKLQYCSIIEHMDKGSLK